MKAIFVNECGSIGYASAIVSGDKVIETRARDMLASCVGERVAVIRTGKGKPVIIGYVDIWQKMFCPVYEFNRFQWAHLVPPESRYSCHGRGKWFYYLAWAEKCDPIPLSACSAVVRHGRSWAEITI